MPDHNRPAYSSADADARLHGLLTMWTGTRGRVLFVVSLGWLIILGTRLVVPALLPHIRAEFGFTHTVGGFIFTTILFVAALLQYPGGMIADRIGDRFILATSITVILAAVAIMTISSAFTVFFLGIVLFGVGTGLYGTPRVTVLSRLFPDRDGTAIGISSAAGNIGTTILPVIAGGLAVIIGWRAGFGFILPVIVVTALATWVYLPAHQPPAAFSVRENLKAVTRSLRLRSVLVVSIAMICTFFVYQGVTAFLPTYLIEEKAISPGLAAGLFGLFFAGGVIAQLAGGILGDRYGRRPTLAGITALTALMLFTLPFVTSLPGIIIVILALSVQLGFWPIAFSYAVAALPDAIEASGLGLLRSSYLIVGSLGSLAVGVFADAALFDEAFLTLGVIIVVVTALVLVLPAAD